MCGRIVFPGSEEIVDKLGLIYNGPDVSNSLNQPPGSLVPVITNEKPNELQYHLWSVIPPFSTTGKPDWKYKTFNATFEKLTTSRTWQQLIEKKHCVFITSGFYEWEKLEPEKKSGKKQIHFIREKDRQFTYMAGLWDVWVNKSTGEMIPNCTMITHPANDFMAPIHDRMPAFIKQEYIEGWLDSSRPLEERLKLIEPVGFDYLQAYRMEKVNEREEFEKVPNFC